MNHSAILLFTLAAMHFLFGNKAVAQFTVTPEWSDEFSLSGAPDPSKWAYETGGGGWGNNELQHYTARRENARVENGALVINARQENYGGNGFTSARLHSHGLGDWKYGRIEVRSRFTGAPGTWPAIWMLPTDWVYGNWPGSGEIDIMEHVSTHGTSVQASIHTKDYNFQINTARIAIQGDIDHWNWHTYTLEWFPHRIDVWVDGIRYFSFRDEGAGWTKWPFDQRFHLMLNVAVGGWGGSPSFTSETMEIDHVRVFPYTGTSQVPVNAAQWFRLVNRQSGKVLDVAGPSNADGANIHQWTWLGTDSQQWRFEPAGDGSYKIINRFTGKLPDTAGGSWANGANVQQWADVGTPQQKWWLRSVGGGYYKLINSETGRLMEVVYNQSANGANVQQWADVNDTNQQWSVEPLGTTPPPAPTGLTAVVRDEATHLSWNAVPGVSGYRVKRATGSSGTFSSIGPDVTATTFADTSRADGTHYRYQVVACVASEESAPSAAISVAPAGLPPGWIRSDIGSVGAEGSANFPDGQFVLAGAGADIWGTADAFRFARVEMNGDGIIIARVDSLENTDPWAKAGIMIRESSAAGAKNVLLALTAGNGATFQWREASNGASQAVVSGGASGPGWLKLVRSGDTFTGFRSADGVAWIPAGSATVSMAASVRAGLAVTSHADPVLNTARFSKVSILGAGWSSQDIGAPAMSGAASFNADGEWMVAGSGANIAGTADEFHFVSQEFSGDGSLTAKVAAVETTDPYAKAGLMFRESAAADSKYAFAFVGPSTVGFECRTATGATMTGAAYIGGTAPRWVRLVRSGTSFAASYSSDGITWTALGTAQTIPMSLSSKAGLSVTAHNVADVCESTFESVSLLPAAWSARDIGDPGLPGGTVHQASTGAWTLAGSGADIWTSEDQMHLAYQSLAGDSVIVARVAALQNTHTYAKAGVMMRSSTAIGSRNAAVLATPGGVQFQTRPTGDGTTNLIGSAAVSQPVWVRLARSGTSYTGWYSSDGLAWTRLGTPQSLTMSASPLAGLALTSHNDSVLNTATLDNVSLSVLPAGFSSWTAFQNANFNAGQLTNPAVSGPLADANADGLENLLAYAFGISPWTPASAGNGGIPTGQIQNGYLTLTWTRLRNPIDVTYAIEVTSDLTTWNSGPAFTTEFAITPLDAIRERVTVRDNTAVTGAARRLMRVKVIQPAP